MVFLYPVYCQRYIDLKWALQRVTFHYCNSLGFLRLNYNIHLYITLPVKENHDPGLMSDSHKSKLYTELVMTWAIQHLYNAGKDCRSKFFQVCLSKTTSLAMV